VTNLVLFALIGSAGVFVFFWSIGRSRAVRDDMLGARLKAYGEDGTTLEDIDLQAPFVERVIEPLIAGVRTFLERQTPAKAQQLLRGQLALAGVRRLTPSDFQAVRYVGAIGLFAAGLLIGVLTKITLVIPVAAAVGAILGFYFPILWLNQKVNGRRSDIQKALPDAMDLLTIAVEAGLGFDLAMVRVTEKFKNALSNEFAGVIQEIRLGRPRLEALDDMGRRCGVDDLHNFCQAVVQSEQMGVGVAKILRLQSEEMRRKRRQRAQEKAAQATLKMMLPMVGCIFPTVWIILLGPAVFLAMKSCG
jgi:tight adherence protein C